MDVHLVGGGGFDANHYLLEHDSQGLLVDAGTGMATDATLQRTRTHLDAADVTRIYLTHWHHDHTGGAPRIARELDAEILMPEAEAIAVREGRADLTLGDRFGAKQEAHPVTGVEPEDEIPLGDTTLTVLSTPGHTAGHTSLWHEASGTLLAGDAVFTGGSFGRVDLPTGDPQAMLETLERLAKMPIEDLHPGHLDPVQGDAQKHVEMALSNARGML